MLQLLAEAAHRINRIARRCWSEQPCGQFYAFLRESIEKSMRSVLNLRNDALLQGHSIQHKLPEAAGFGDTTGFVKMIPVKGVGPARTKKCSDELLLTVDFFLFFGYT